MGLRDDINVFDGTHDVAIAQFYICAMYKIPIGMATIEHIKKNYPEYFTLN